MILQQRSDRGRQHRGRINTEGVMAEAQIMNPDGPTQSIRIQRGNACV